MISKNGKAENRSPAHGRETPSSWCDIASTKSSIDHSSVARSACIRRIRARATSSRRRGTKIERSRNSASPVNQHVTLVAISLSLVGFAYKRYGTERIRARGPARLHQLTVRSACIRRIRAGTTSSRGVVRKSSDHGGLGFSFARDSGGGPKPATPHAKLDELQPNPLDCQQLTKWLRLAVRFAEVGSSVSLRPDFLLQTGCVA